GFQPISLKSNEIRTVSLVTEKYAHQFFLDPRYSLPLDSNSHRIVEGVRLKSMDAAGRIYEVTYVVSQLKIPTNWNGGPKEYTFDCRPHELLKNFEASVPEI